MRAPSTFAVCVLLLTSLAAVHPDPCPGDDGRAVPLALLPPDPKAAAADWEIIGPPRRAELAVVVDELLARKTLEIAQGQSFTFISKRGFGAAYTVTAWVRFTGTGRKQGSAMLACGVSGLEPDAPAVYSLALAASRGAGQADDFTLLPSLGGNKPWTNIAGPRRRAGIWGHNIRIRPRYGLEDVSPVMNEDLRLALEDTIRQYPTADSYWRRLRIEVSPQRVRMYHNGFLVVDDANRMLSDGRVRLTAANGIRLAQIRITPSGPETGSFHTVPLDDLCNAKGFAETNSLGAAGDQIRIDHVPVLLPQGVGACDHVDVGASLFRYRMERGYRPAADPSFICPGPEELDPVRLRLRVPNRAYRRAWILAAADGDPLSVPVLTIRFYHPRAGWWVDAATRVPEPGAKTPPPGARPVPVKLQGARGGNLWLVPVELDTAAIASEFHEESLLTIELTKEVKDHVAYPDPCNFGAYQAGLPSSARLYGLTLEEAPLSAIAAAPHVGHVFPHPERPRWLVDLSSQTPQELKARVRLTVQSPYGHVEKLEQELGLPAKGRNQAVFQPTPREYGLYRVTTEVASGDWSQARQATFLTLPPDRRMAGPGESPWGTWVWGGGHTTIADPTDIARLMYVLGLRIGYPMELKDFDNLYQRGRELGSHYFRRTWQLGPDHYRIVGRAMPPWMYQTPPHPAEYAKFVDEIAAKARQLKAAHPDLQFVNSLAENAISLRATHGIPPYAFGQPWFDYTDVEKERIRVLWLGSIAGYEGVKSAGVSLKYVFGHCSPCFFLPFFREPAWNNERFDGLGLDMPQFSRMPERQPRATEPSSLYFLSQEMKDRKIVKELVHLESYFPSSLPLALGHRGQADSVVRTAVLSLALGTTRFMACWSLDDCADRWGSQHYGCCGFFSRRPESLPKPAAAAMATMTAMLDSAKYDGWLSTGSRSAFCLRFKDQRRRPRLVYCVWTVRGTRPLTVAAAPKTSLVQVDENGNESPVALNGGQGTVQLSPTPLWLVATDGSIEKVEAQPPRYTETPAEHRIVLDNFEKADWRPVPGSHERFEKNHWDVVREPAGMLSQRAPAAERGSKVWQIALENAPQGKPMVGFYGVFQPPQPIEIPGKARALGVYGNGRSAWNRVVYELVDAKGEVWMNCGTKDVFNCDDQHSWSYLNFDGWRYMEFPLPGNAPGDDYREKHTAWWGHSAEGVVDLPLRLSRIIVSMSTHMIYVDQMLPVDSLAIELDDLTAVYDQPEDMTEAPVKLQRAAAGMLKPRQTGGEGLPNPYQALQADGAAPPPEILRLYPPEQNDGQQIYVELRPVPGAAAYKVYVAAYADGRGAKAMGAPLKDKPATVHLRGLQPGIPLYLFATTVDAQKKESKPSPLRKTVLKDEFPMK